MRKILQNIILILSVSYNLNARQLIPLSSAGNYFHAYSIYLVENESKILSFPEPFTAFSVLIPVSHAFDELIIKSDDHQFFLRAFHEEEIVLSDSLQVSELMFTAGPAQKLFIKNTGKTIQIIVHTYSAGTVLQPVNQFFAEGIDCSKPFMIDQETWRSGLPSPVVKPTFTKTHHLVIHHSAGSNSSVNHLEDVRNIYLYHTQTLGWDDIGYNFLIARDGTIYAGRDGQGLMEDDFVKGAHFCGKNANTMGICLLGEYSISLPTPQAILSLKKLILWKCFKDQLQPLDSRLHPVGSDSAIMLPVICGHRDGCNTECPGLAAYLMIPALRHEVDSLLKLCNPLSYSSGIQPSEVCLITDPSHGKVIMKIQQADIYLIDLLDINGQKIRQIYPPFSDGTIFFDQLKSGFWIIRIFMADKIDCHKVFIY